MRMCRNDHPGGFSSDHCWCPALQALGCSTWELSALFSPPSSNTDFLAVPLHRVMAYTRHEAMPDMPRPHKYLFFAVRFTSLGFVISSCIHTL